MQRDGPIRGSSRPHVRRGGDKAEKTAGQAAGNLAALIQSATVVADAARGISSELIDVVRHSTERSIDHVGAMRKRPTYFCMISSIGTPTSSGGRGCRATATVTLLFANHRREFYSAYCAIGIDLCLAIDRAMLRLHQVPTFASDGPARLIVDRSEPATSSASSGKGLHPQLPITGPDRGL